MQKTNWLEVYKIFFTPITIRSLLVKADILWADADTMRHQQSNFKLIIEIDDIPMSHFTLAEVILKLQSYPSTEVRLVEASIEAIFGCTPSPSKRQFWELDLLIGE